MSAWVFAPLATATAAALVLYVLRTFVLRRANPAKWSMAVLPVAVFITTWVNIYFVFTKVRARGLDSVFTLQLQWPPGACVVAGS